MSESSKRARQGGLDPSVLAVDEFVVLFHRAAAVAASVADLAEREAERAARRGDSAGARTAQARAIRTRRAAAHGRDAARRLHLRRQATQLLDPPRCWDAYLARGGDTAHAPECPALPQVAAAVIGTDLNGTVRLWNGAAQRLYGWTRSKVLGRPIRELTIGPEDEEVAERILSCVRHTGSWEGEFWVRRHDQTRFLAYVRDALVRNIDGRSVGIVGVSIDLDPGMFIEVPDVLGGLETNVASSRRRPVR